MKSILLSSLILLFILPNSYSQNNFEINFGTTYNDIGYSVQQTIEGQYIVTGISYDSTSKSNIFYSKIDVDGTILWTKYLGDSLNDEAYCVRQTSDSGFILLGMTLNHGNGSGDFYLIRTDMNGDTSWTKTFGGTGYDFGTMVQNTFDGGFVLCGQEENVGANATEMLLVKTNANGAMIWSKTYLFGSGSGAVAVGIVQNADSGYMAFGDFENDVTGNGDYDLVWIKTDQNGDTSWSKTSEDTLYKDYAETIHKTNDGGWILVSQRIAIYTSELSSTKILKLDVNGDTAWTKLFGITYDFSGLDIFQSPDSGYILTGYSYDAGTSINSLFLTKLNSAGDSLWTKYYVGLQHATGNSNFGTSDGGIVACGSTTDFSLTQNVYVIKTNGSGDLVDCQPSITLEPADTVVYETHDGAFFISAPTAISYQWQYDSAGTFVNIYDNSIYMGSTNDSLLITSAQLSMDGYQYRCVVTDNASCIEISDTVLLSVNINIGISNVKTDNQYLYPNPASKIISISGAIPDKIILYDVLGNELAHYQNQKMIDLSSMSKGIYFLKCYLKYDVTVFRFLKN